MLCRDVKRVVTFFLDGSLGEVKKQEFDSHVRLCRDCDERTKILTKLRIFVERRLDRICTPAPDHLKTRLTRSIRAFRAEWSR